MCSRSRPTVWPTDSSYALYFTNLVHGSDEVQNSILDAIPTSGGTATVLSSNNPAVVDALDGTTVLYADNMTAVSGGNAGAQPQYRFDLHRVDLSNLSSAKLVAPQVDTSFWITADNSKVVYSYSVPTNGSLDGVWVTSL